MTETIRKTLWTLLAAVHLSLGACGEAADTAMAQVLVTIDSDLHADVSKVEVQVLDARAEVVGSAHIFEIQGDDSWPVTFAVSPTRGKESGSFLVIARGLNAAGELLVEGKGILTFVRAKATTASLWLLSACRGVTCAGLQTCVGRGSQAGTCDAVPVLDTQVAEPGSQPTSRNGMPPTLTPPAAGEPGSSTTTEGTVAAGTDGGAAQGGPGAPGVDGGPQVVVPRVDNVPTLAGFSSLGEPRRSNGGLLLLDDGFELGARACNTAGACATASFAP